MMWDVDKSSHFYINDWCSQYHLQKTLSYLYLLVFDENVCKVACKLPMLTNSFLKIFADSIGLPT
jgi:hypothetical protein